ncbi:hypothetical protein D9M71_804660 [compost metagenome]
MTVTRLTKSGSKGTLMSPLKAFMPRMDWPSSSTCTRLPPRLRITGAPAFGPKALLCTPDTCSSMVPSVRFWAWMFSTTTTVSTRDGRSASTVTSGSVVSSAA